MPRKTSNEPMSGPVTLRFHRDTVSEIKDASKKTHLSEADTIRQATKMGLPLLLKALKVKTRRATTREAVAA